MNVPTDMPLAAWIRSLIDAQVLWKFYKTSEWLRLRGDIMRDAHGECQWCKARSPAKITPAETAHHLYPVKDYPQLALTRCINGKQVIVPLCHDCHDLAHKRFRHAPPKPQFNQERW